MKRTPIHSVCLGQTALEYLLILSVAGAIVLVCFKALLPKVQTNSETYYTSVTDVILGNNPDGKTLQPIHGGWCEVKCPTTAGVGNPVMYRTCECPSPAFGGRYCSPTDTGPDHNCVGDKCSCSGQVLPTSCISNGTCSAPEPGCGQVTFGEDNCGGACTRQGPTCPH